MPSPLSHTEITKATARIIDKANQIDDVYRWGHMLGVRRRSSGQLEGGRSGTSNPTLAVIEAETSRFQRTKISRASDAIVKAEAALDLALAALAAAFKAENESHKLSLEPLQGEPIRTAELRQAHRAKDRRTARGEGWGEG